MARKNSSRINVAVVGLGFMGVTHLRAYQKISNARIVAVCGRSRLPQGGVLAGVAGNIKASETIHLGSDVKVYREFDELLADPSIDIVDICSPTPMHSEQAIAALKAAKHVLCEKPIARTSAAAKEILKVASVSQTFLMPAMCMRFWPGWASSQFALARKQYGTVLAAHFHRASAMPAWSRDSYAADSGGALFDLHIHDNDFINFLFGPPEGVFSTGVIGADGIINHVVTQYHYPGGPVVSAEGSWLRAHGFNMGFTIHCEKATLDFDLARGADALRKDEPSRGSHFVELPQPDGYENEIKYFVNCVAAGKKPTLVTAADSVTALEICEAEERSIRTGKIIKL